MHNDRSGDISPEELQEHGRRVMSWIAQHFERIEERPVLARVAPGDVASRFAADAPETGRNLQELLAEFDEAIVPGMTHWNHPGFLAYFGTSASAAGILAETLTAALNVNAMLWRTSPAATELEMVALDWLRQMVALPDHFRGHIQDTASTSTMVALAAARGAAVPEVRERGLAAGPQLAIYCSEEAHSSVDKAAITLGLGLAGVRRIPTDDAFRLRPDLLAAAIEADLAAGVKPVAVVATIGTTSTTSIDPVPDIVRLCRRHGIWLHVDAAYGGAAATVPGMRPLFAGWERADSIVINPHKWLFVPMDCSALYLKEPEVLRRAFAILPEYLRTPEGDAVVNLMDYGPALGRRFRALKLWMTLAHFGRQGIAARISEHVRIAGRLAGWIEESPGWELAAPAPFSTICFRHRDQARDEEENDRINAAALERVNASGKVFLSSTRVRGRVVMRLAIGNIRTTEAHVREAWELVRSSV